MTNESAGENTTATTASKTTGSSETQVASGRNSCRNSNVRRLLLEVARKSYIQAHNAWVTSLPPVTATAPQSGDLIGLGSGTRRNYTGVRVDGTDSAFVFADAAHTDERRAEHGSFYIEGDDGNKSVCPTALHVAASSLLGLGRHSRNPLTTGPRAQRWRETLHVLSWQLTSDARH